MNGERTRRRRLTWIALGAVALVVAVSLVVAALSRPQPAPEASPTPEPTPTASDPLRPAVHLTPAEHWMNDPQRPFFAGGRWHAYYLCNADYPEGNGTAWYHVTSTDLVHWQDEGVAIDKYRNGLGDIQSGSAVVDTENTAGFGSGAIVALVTQQDAGIQRQSLYYSTDDGYTFTQGPGNPVLDNPGSADFRDPKVVRDDTARQWVMTLAEGDKIGFYTSPDLATWTYRSGFVRDDLGLLECPDLFQMSVDGRPTWVLGASAHGADRTTGYAYWTGEWDGQAFTPTDLDPLWLDDGADFYAAVTWSDDRLPADQQLTSRYALGWVNNWTYARELPTDAWQGGAQSIVRQVELVEQDGRLRLQAGPIDALAEAESGVVRTESLAVTAGDPHRLEPGPAGTATRVRLSLHEAEVSGPLALVLGDDEGRVRVVVDPAAGQVRIERAGDAAAAQLPELYRAVQSTPLVWHDGRALLDVIVDGLTLEVFGGARPMASLVFLGSTALALESTAAATVAAVAVSTIR